MKRLLMRATLIGLASMMAVACATRPKKYRKKRGCDCPHWNSLPSDRGSHATARSLQLPS